jgi:hypothetical protein
MDDLNTIILNFTLSTIADIQISEVDAKTESWHSIQL